MTTIQAPSIEAIEEDGTVLYYNVSYDGFTKSFNRQKRAQRWLKVLEDTYRASLAGEEEN